MKIQAYQINTFTSDTFSGNPAIVCVLSELLSDEEYQKIAIDNNAPVTAFIKPEADHFYIRWFTPEYELDLCGHGTLAASFVIFNELKAAKGEVIFHSPKAGTLVVKQVGDKIELNFPLKAISKILMPAGLIEGLGDKPTEIYEHHHERLLAVFDDEQFVRNIKPNFEFLKLLPHTAIVVTAPSSSADFVSRTFYPKKKDQEDQVTGASHCLLVPYWAQRLGKFTLLAHQVSPRGGEIFCELQGDRVLMAGRAVSSGKFEK